MKYLNALFFPIPCFSLIWRHIFKASLMSNLNKQKKITSIRWKYFYYCYWAKHNYSGFLRDIFILAFCIFFIDFFSVTENDYRKSYRILSSTTSRKVERSIVISRSQWTFWQKNNQQNQSWKMVQEVKSGDTNLANLQRNRLKDLISKTRYFWKPWN